MKRPSIWITLSLIMGLALLVWKTQTRLLPPPETLMITETRVQKAQLLDRHGLPLTITYQNNWNIHDQVPLHDIPEQLQDVFIIAEDKRFFEHPGLDWQARIHAMLQNILALRIVRGASTITEQSVRMIHVRPRTFWSRWLEGFEAARFEAQFSKADILEFYLNQVPYASRRRGVVQAARYYFARSLDTLNLKEMMALAVLVRAPSRLDLWQSTTAIEPSIQRLAQRLREEQLITPKEYHTALATPLTVREFELPVKATHFVRHVYAHTQSPQPNQIITTLDSRLQYSIQKLLDKQLETLDTKNVHNGAVLVVDHLNNNEVLAWVNGGNLIEVPGAQIDAVTTPRQPGSTLKPFLYALALEKGWTAATLIDDTPLTRPVGTGIHRYRNYSRSYHGQLRLREALGNSLNTPAIRTIQFVGVSHFLQRLHQLGFDSLDKTARFYGEGLALGNGEVTLYELVQAYTSLAHQGLLQPLTLKPQRQLQHNIMTPEISSLIGHILSDPQARRLEFGRSDLLDLPVQTAVKTGTSTDYRDAWALGFNYRYTVGVWLGNLDQQPMHAVSGASGPGLILRAVFAELNRYEDTQGLYLSPKLIEVPICRNSGQRAHAHCPSQTEWFIAGTEPREHRPTQPTTVASSAIHLKQPTPGLQLAVDPRIPDDQEAFAFILSQPLMPNQRIEWLVDGSVMATTLADNSIPQFLWPMQQGSHVAQARIWTAQTPQPITTPAVTFYVK